MWASDALNGSLADLNWTQLQAELAQRRDVWVDAIIAHAKSHDEFFPKPDVEDADNGE